jgi:hypothetical protein
MNERAMEVRFVAEHMADCELLASFVTRQSIIAIAGVAFLIYTYVRRKCGKEKRDLRTFAADVSKQGGQQMFGGVLMAATAVLLEESGRGLDPLAWYGAEYPFEVVLTTVFTSWLRRANDGFFSWLQRQTGAKCLEPFVNFGKYAPSEGDFRCSWYWAQMLQAVLIIGVGARIISVLAIVASLNYLPEAYSPVLQLGRAWYDSGMTCSARTVATLYVMPVVGDTIQFVIIDSIQKFRAHSTPVQRTALF